MAKIRYAMQTRIIKVTDPTVLDDKGEPIVLFEAKVDIQNLRTDLVKKITNVQIKYDLKYRGRDS